MGNIQAKRTPIGQIAGSFILLVFLCLSGQQSARAGSARQDASLTPTPGVILPDPAVLIAEINNLRLAHGVQPLTIHPALMKIAQAEANGIAMGDPGHWRPNGLTLGQWLIMEGYPLSGDLTQDGYRSENWSWTTSAQGAIDQLHEWISSGDDPHTNTMLSEFRSDIGVAVSSSKDDYGKDQIYFVIETALRTGTGQQQSEAKDFLTSLPSILQGAKSVDGTPIALSEGQYIIPVKVNTARPDGDVLHQVQPGQSLWSIAIFYHTTIDQIRRLNNMGTDNTVYQGQKLLVKKGATQPVPTATITPTTAISATPWPTLPLKVTPSPVSTAAPSENNGNITTIVGVLFVAFIILAGVIGSSLKMKS